MAELTPELEREIREEYTLNSVPADRHVRALLAALDQAREALGDPDPETPLKSDLIRRDHAMDAVLTALGPKANLAIRALWCVRPPSLRSQPAPEEGCRWDCWCGTCKDRGEGRFGIPGFNPYDTDEENRARIPQPAPEPPCERCGGEGYEVLDFGRGPGAEAMEPCPECRP